MSERDTYSLCLFRHRLDGELLSYAAKKLSEIRPEASLNREAGTTEAANVDARPAASAISSPSGAEPRADTPSDSFVFATLEPDRYDVRYHVPRSQVWEGSRGGQRGNVHLHVKAAFHLGRIHRNAGEALCGKSGWFERPLDELEVATACPRCAEIELRRRG